MKPRTDTLHGDVRTDNYFWIREIQRIPTNALSTGKWADWIPVTDSVFIE